MTMINCKILITVCFGFVRFANFAYPILRSKHPIIFSYINTVCFLVLPVAFICNVKIFLGGVIFLLALRNFFFVLYLICLLTFFIT